MFDSYQSLVKHKRSMYEDILYCYRGYNPEYITSIIDEFYTIQKIPSIFGGVMYVPLRLIMFQIDSTEIL